MNDVLETLMGIIVIWLIGNIVPVILGYEYKTTRYMQSNCDTITRIEYIFPGAILGCWLGEGTLRE